MTQLSDLINENKNLKRKLQISQLWMQRQVHESLQMIIESRQKEQSRQKFDSFFEDQIFQEISKNIETYFSYFLSNAPKYTLERLLDAEVQWYTLQKFPHMDWFPVAALYQKILDATFEMLTDPLTRMQEFPHFSVNLDGIEKDIALIFSKKYTLSLGRWYQLFSFLRSWKMKSEYIDNFVSLIEKDHPWIFWFLISDAFFLPFETLIQMEVFQWKRHEKKMSFSDAKNTRDICISWFQWDSLLLSLFQNL